MENISPLQGELLDRLRATDPELIVHWDEARGVAGSVRGALFLGDGEAALAGFLAEFGALLGVPSGGAEESLRLLSRTSDELGWTHLVYAHEVPLDAIGRAEVYGAKLAAHLDEHGTLIEAQSSLWRDLEVDGELRVEVDELRRALLGRIEDVDGFAELRDEVGPEEPDFPMTDPPRVVVYPWRGRFPVVWSTYGYADTDLGPSGERTDTTSISYGQIFVDATSGERILFAPTLKFVESPTTGTGLAVTPITGTKTTRSLHVVRVDSSKNYRLRNTTHKRDIVTFDAECKSSLGSSVAIANALNKDTVPVSADTDGDHDWDREPSSTTAAQRVAAQLPEVDAHYFVDRQYRWYEALGRTGWDDDNYQDPPVPDQAINVLAHARHPTDGCQVLNGYQTRVKTGGKWVTWLAFMDGDGTMWDYPAGSHFLVAHEYQHAITDFSFVDGAGNPGLLYSGWKGAVHEGLSDAFGGLSSEQWRPCRDVSHAAPAQSLRNLVYPRDTLPLAPNMLDHFDDRNTSVDFYVRGTILAHCAYLMGKGGVHQRHGRSPVLIPVSSIGHSTVKGLSMPTAARIWYRALDKYCSTIGSASGSGDADTFRTIRNACVSAAKDLYGTSSAEHRNTVLAFYAVGLHPEQYGPDVTFLRWGSSWDLSRSYVGMTCPNYSSLDLFVNNGGMSEWNAQVNVLDSSGTATELENDVYCRVRNVGDQSALNVEVEFHYAKAGTATINWLPVKDKKGTVQKLSVGTLAAGASNFDDAAQHSPPATARIKWCVPPLATGEVVDHYCLRARVTASNDVNTFNNEVQSNVAYVAYSPPKPSTAAIIVGNPDEELELEADLRLEHTVPASWHAAIREDLTGVLLAPREERAVHVSVEPAADAHERLEPPLDGDLRGRLTGEIHGSFTGTISDTSLDGTELRGLLAARIGNGAPIAGPFLGTVDLRTAEVDGTVIVDHPATRAGERLELRVRACLRPWRRVEVSQWRENELIGGVTVQVQVPFGAAPCRLDLPPTSTRVEPGIVRRDRWRIPIPAHGIVAHYRRDGERLLMLDGDGAATGVAVGPQSETYLTARGDERIRRFGADGELVAEWPVEGIPHGVGCTLDGRAVVTVPEQDLVQLFSADGEPAGEFSVPGRPGSIGVGHDGRCFVSSFEGRFVLAYAPDGALLHEWRVEEGVLDVNGIALAAGGRLVVVASPAGRVIVFNPEGDRMGEWTVDGRPSIVVASDDHVAVALDDGRRVQIHDLDGRIVERWETGLG